MVPARSIEALLDSLLENFQPEKVILFGSHAAGAPDLDSDVDLLIVINYRGRRNLVATKVRLLRDARLPLDVVVRTPMQLQKAVRQQDWFIIEILEQGITLYDRADKRVGEKGRRRLRRRLAPAALAQAKPLRQHQCVEKYFKAKLQEQHVRIPRTHDLVTLLELLMPIEPAWALVQPELASLTEGAVEVRYPSKWSSAADARRAFITAERMRALVRLSLGLKAK